MLNLEQKAALEQALASRTEGAKGSLPAWLNDLQRECDQVLLSTHEDWTVQRVSEAMLKLAPTMRSVSVNRSELPWGRYLLLADPQGRYNLQLDVFSAAYTGGLHAHGTYGIFFVLQGRLNAWEYQAPADVRDLGEMTLLAASSIPAGGSSCFCPPVSDWHRVSTVAGEAQTVSLHLYGPGFDLEVGVGVLENGRAGTYRRSAFRPLGEVIDALSWTGAGEAR